MIHSWCFMVIHHSFIHSSSIDNNHHEGDVDDRPVVLGALGWSVHFQGRCVSQMGFYLQDGIMCTCFPFSPGPQQSCLFKDDSKDFGWIIIQTLSKGTQRCLCSVWGICILYTYTTDIHIHRERMNEWIMCILYNIYSTYFTNLDFCSPFIDVFLFTL